MNARGALWLILGCALAAGDARAQSPEKFERVVPSTPRPMGPTHSSPVIQELVRKAQAKAPEDGFCAKMPATWTPNPNNVFLAKPAGAEHQFHGQPPIGPKTCGLQRITAVVMDKGKRCVIVIRWLCSVGQVCEYGREKHCDDGAGNYSYVPR